MATERLRSQRTVLIAGQLLLVASQVLLMESPAFWMMCIGRLLEGFATSVIVVSGSALICENTPEEDVGQYLGMAMVGMPLGQMLAPPVGGALFRRWGYRAPFIFTILFTILDLPARLLVHERLQTDQTAATVLRTDTEKEEVPQSAEKDVEVQDQAILNSEAAVTHTEDPKITTPVATERVSLSFPQVVYKLLTSVRTVVVLISLDATLPLRVQVVWGLDSAKVGLVYLASVVPTVVSSPLAGKLSDKYGPAWVATVLFICGIPWFGLLTLHFSLAFFIVSFAVENFFIAATVSPIMTELAAVTRTMEGISYVHTYGALNVVLGLGNAAGSVVGGQIYGHLSSGWDVLCYIDIAVLAIALALILLFTGETPILRFPPRS
ncbi:major facilitator superfamily domain-containing protein [Fomitopsis betulina]|nr:major facilitator superfamily domain-containing protein [Fomitopsis betulina]